MIARAAVFPSSKPSSHRSVLRAARALRHRPIDGLLGSLYRAALAVHAILRVDLQAHLAILIGQILIDLGWAEPPLWTVIRRQGHLQWHRGLLGLHLQVCRLIMLVVDSAPD